MVAPYCRLRPRGIAGAATGVGSGRDVQRGVADHAQSDAGHGRMRNAALLRRPGTVRRRLSAPRDPEHGAPFRWRLLCRRALTPVAGSRGVQRCAGLLGATRGWRSRARRVGARFSRSPESASNELDRWDAGRSRGRREWSLSQHQTGSRPHSLDRRIHLAALLPRWRYAAMIGGPWSEPGFASCRKLSRLNDKNLVRGTMSAI